MWYQSDRSSDRGGDGAASGWERSRRECFKSVQALLDEIIVEMREWRSENQEMHKRLLSNPPIINNNKRADLSLEESRNVLAKDGQVEEDKKSALSKESRDLVSTMDESTPLASTEDECAPLASIAPHDVEELRSVVAVKKESLQEQPSEDGKSTTSCAIRSKNFFEPPINTSCNFSIQITPIVGYLPNYDLLVASMISVGSLMEIDRVYNGALTSSVWDPGGIGVEEVLLVNTCKMFGEMPKRNRDVIFWNFLLGTYGQNGVAEASCAIFIEENNAGNAGDLERLEMELIELLKSRKGVPVSIAALPMFYLDKYGQNLQADGYLTESQRQGKTGYNLTRLLVRLKNSIRLIDRPHGQHSVVLVEDVPRFMDYKNERNDGAKASMSRQIYLTFPAESTFSADDVEQYFSNYGPVQDVRIPIQQKMRMIYFAIHVQFTHNDDEISDDYNNEDVDDFDWLGPNDLASVDIWVQFMIDWNATNLQFNLSVTRGSLYYFMPLDDYCGFVNSDVDPRELFCEIFFHKAVVRLHKLGKVSDADACFERTFFSPAFSRVIDLIRSWITRISDLIIPQIVFHACAEVLSREQCDSEAEGLGSSHIDTTVLASAEKAVDKVHCIAEWVHGVWKDYKQLDGLLEFLLDKPNTGCIMHYECPKSLESYYQESGCFTYETSRYFSSSMAEWKSVQDPKSSSVADIKGSNVPSRLNFSNNLCCLRVSDQCLLQALGNTTSMTATSKHSTLCLTIENGFESQMSTPASGDLFDVLHVKLGSGKFSNHSTGPSIGHHLNDDKVISVSSTFVIELVDPSNKFNDFSCADITCPKSLFLLRTDAASLVKQIALEVAGIELANEVVPVVKKVLALAGVCGTDSSHQMQNGYLLFAISRVESSWKVYDFAPTKGALEISLKALGQNYHVHVVLFSELLQKRVVLGANNLMLVALERGIGFEDFSYKSLVQTLCKEDRPKGEVNILSKLTNKDYIFQSTVILSVIDELYKQEKNCEADNWIEFLIEMATHCNHLKQKMTSYWWKGKPIIYALFFPNLELAIQGDFAAILMLPRKFHTLSDRIWVSKRVRGTVLHDIGLNDDFSSKEAIRNHGWCLLQTAQTARPRIEQFEKGGYVNICAQAYNSDREIINIRTRSMEKPKSKKQLVGIFDHFLEKHTLAELSDSSWSFLYPSWVCWIELDFDKKRCTVNLSGDLSLRFFYIMQLDKYDFVTLVGFSGEYLYGKAMALLNLKSNSLKVNDDPFVFGRLILAFDFAKKEEVNHITLKECDIIEETLTIRDIDDSLGAQTGNQSCSELYGFQSCHFKSTSCCDLSFGCLQVHCCRSSWRGN